MFIKKISNEDKSIKFLSSRIIKNLNIDDFEYYKFIDKYFFDYCKFNNVDIKRILRVRKKFSKRYIIDINIFKEKKKYPYLLNRNFKLSRLEYDIILLLSYLIEKHRFEIIKSILAKRIYGKILFIGSGPSLELAIVKHYAKKNCKISSYDKNFNKFVLKNFKKESFSSEYDFKSKEKFDNIFLIEFLEHLKKPYIFLKKIKKNLYKSGNLFVTTAINIPQFDHYYNFKEREILQKLKKYNFKCNLYKKIDHITFVNSINSSNEFLIIKNDKGKP